MLTLEIIAVRVVFYLNLNTVNKLTPEMIELLSKWLKNAVPYTEQEIVDIPFDSKEYNSDRWKAYTAQKILKKAGII